MHGGRAKEPEALQPGKTVDPAVEAGHHAATLVPAEQVADHEPHLRLGHHVRPDWPPEAAQREPRQPLGSAVTVQADDGLVGVEVDVPALLAHDPPQQLGQHRVPGRGGAGRRGPVAGAAAFLAGPVSGYVTVRWAERVHRLGGVARARAVMADRGELVAGLEQQRADLIEATAALVSVPAPSAR